jgi:hypothetical protein
MTSGRWCEWISGRDSSGLDLSHRSWEVWTRVVVLRGVGGTGSRRTVMAARAGGRRRRRKTGLKKIAMLYGMRLVVVEYFGGVRCFQNSVFLVSLGSKFKYRVFLVELYLLIVCYASQRRLDYKSKPILYCSTIKCISFQKTGE